MGKMIDVSFYKARDGVMGVCGVLVSKDDNKLVLETDDKNMELDMAEVALVKLHFEI